MNFKRAKSIKGVLLGAVMAASVIAGQFVPLAHAAIANNTASWTGTAPKYVFLFIGDGMSYAQSAIATDYLGAMNDKVESVDLAMTKFPVAGSATTFDATSFAPDSASTATSIATGQKTWSGTINMELDLTTPIETITEKVKEQLKWKVGVVSTVNLNHATPAAFYGHQASRGSTYQLSEELAASGFDYFAGGRLMDNRGVGASPDDIPNKLAANGYTVARTTAEYRALSGNESKVAIFTEDKADADAMYFDLDRPDATPSLADYVETGIEVLDNGTGFFMMVEGGKIDWAAHANDARAVIDDVIAMNEGIEKAVDFYEEHPTETLILVTGDHETGGLSIGYAGQGYTTNLQMLDKQTMTAYTVFADEIAKFREEGTGFEDVMAIIEKNYGLVLAANATEETDPLFVLSGYEESILKEAYEKSMLPLAQRTYDDREKLLFSTPGRYEPLSVAVTHILNQKAGIGWTSYDHTGVPVPVFAMGVGQELFAGYYDNTKIFFNLKALTSVK